MRVRSVVMAAGMYLTFYLIEGFINGPGGLKFTDDDARLGDYWEYYVALKASERGAEVFKNIYRTGATDLVLEWEGMILKCDVKQMREQNGYWKTNGAKKRGSAHVYVNPITHQIRWIKGQEPQGWEGFWK